MGRGLYRFPAKEKGKYPSVFSSRTSSIDREYRRFAKQMPKIFVRYGKAHVEL